MTELRWAGVMPAITTPFDEHDRVDLVAVHAKIGRLVAAGVTGIVPCGSLGEGATLRFEEKLELIGTVVAAAEGRVPVIAAVAAASTEEAIELAREAEGRGCEGLMVLPPYVHSGDPREVRHHFQGIFESTTLPCMLYNNPIAYGADLRAPEIVALAKEHANLLAVKESSGDVRRTTALVDAAGDRLAVFVGLDDYLVEGVRAGAVGWIAGLVNAFPRESVELFERALAGDPEVESVYRWFLPLLRLDVVPDFVQRIKVVEEVMGVGSARVRRPRLPLPPAERAHIAELAEESRRTTPF